MKPKAIFLDIDGVLNTTATRAATKCRFHHVYQNLNRPLTKEDLDIHEESMERLGKLVAEFDPDVVISSMWRFGSKAIHFTEFFALFGINIPPNRITWTKTNELEDLDGQRQEFIEEYLQDNPYDVYVMIDDSPYHFKDEAHPNLVLTNIDHGFTEERYQRARSVLQR